MKTKKMEKLTKRKRSLIDEFIQAMKGQQEKFTIGDTYRKIEKLQVQMKQYGISKKKYNPPVLDTIGSYVYKKK